MDGANGVLGRAVLLGVVAGMRTQLPLALLAAAAKRGQFAASSPPPLGLLNARPALPVLCLSAAGELVVEKLPIAPSRLEPGPLFGRFLFGGIAGAAVAASGGRSAAAGALLGAAGAGIGTYVGFHVRAWAGEVTGLPDPIWGALEDISAVTIGLAATARGPGARSH